MLETAAGEEDGSPSDKGETLLASADVDATTDDGLVDQDLAKDVQDEEVAGRGRVYSAMLLVAFAHLVGNRVGEDRSGPVVVGSCYPAEVVGDNWKVHKQK